ncbi:MAG: OmpA family protein [Pseudomonadota bacterium]
MDSNTRAASGSSKRSLTLRSAIALALAMAPAQASSDCAGERCLTGEGYAIEIIGYTDDRPTQPEDSAEARINNNRVDIAGEFLIRLPGGGQIWATEDPAIVDPRMAVHADDAFAVQNGALAKPISFFVYKNYDAFIDEAVLDIYDGEDFDRLKPIASLPLPPGNFVRVLWDGQSDSPRRPSWTPGDTLYYQARAVDAAQRQDLTTEKMMTALSSADYHAHQQTRLTPSGNLPGDGPALPTNTTTPLDGNVVIMRVPKDGFRYDTLGYTLTPRFDTRKTVLQPTDRAQLDGIIRQWQGASDISLRAVGHTDNVRIAPENRHEFANNQVLSEARARAVADYLKQGLNLAEGQITTLGYGKTQPVASNATTEGRAQNRRVELSITGQREIPFRERQAAITLYDPTSSREVPVTDGLTAAVARLIAEEGGESIIKERGRTDCSAVQDYPHELHALYGRNELIQQNIALYGSRVRLHGHDTARHAAMAVNGQFVPVDASGDFAVEYMMPVGQHTMEVEFFDDRCALGDEAKVPVDVSGKHMFIVALADVTASGSDLSGSIEPLSVDDRFDDDFLVEGRLAFYLKGKVRGKYLITAQLDSREEELSDLLSNLSEKNPRAIFRRLDPDRYYPVYGDDSTTIADTNSIGRLYLRADWDNSHAVWGNFHTGFTGTELAQYNRSLYGGQLNWQSARVTENGVARSALNVFVSENQTELGHSEFIGTGGSLYYLKHTDILPGSEKVRVELRHRDSDRVLENITLVRGVDYEVDELQGRLMLSRPLMQITPLQTPSIVRDGPLDGHLAVLIADYEYIPEGFDPDHIGYGLRGRQWLGDHVAVGLTYAQENRGGGAQDYDLVGGDVRLEYAPNTFIHAEFASTNENQVERFLSNNGGLVFDSIANTVQPGRSGDAFAIDGRLNTLELGMDTEWILSGWYRHADEGFSIARRDAGVEVDEYGAEVVGKIGDRWTWSGRASVVERANQRDDQRLAVQADYQLSERSQLSAELRHVDVDTQTQAVGGLINRSSRLDEGDGTLFGLRLTRKLSDRVTAYAGGQVSIDQGDTYDNNDMGTLGVVAQVGDRTNIISEFNSGHRGDGANVTLDHQINHRHRIYGTYSQSTDRTDTLANNQIAVGQRTVFNNRLAVFNEHQFAEYHNRHAGIAHVFGLDFAPEGSWSFNSTFQTGELDTGRDVIERDAVSAGVVYQNARLRMTTRLELRRDEGNVTDAEQWVASNRLDYKYSDNTRFLARLNVSRTDDAVNTLFDARFTEAQIGMAYRPVEHGRFNFLAKYTYLYDLRGFDQVATNTDQRSNIFSLEGNYRLNPRWEIGGKYAYRVGELRAGRNTGDWFESTTTFYALRARYHLLHRWDALAEYRWLDIDEAGSTRSGFLIGLDRHFGDHLKLGIGYNFTDFSDDLTNLDYDQDGWFVNALGKY